MLGFSLANRSALPLGETSQFLGEGQRPVGDQCLGLGPDLGGDLVDHGEDDVVLAREMHVERLFAHAQLDSEVVHRGATVPRGRRNARAPDAEYERRWHRGRQREKMWARALKSLGNFKSIYSFPASSRIFTGPLLPCGGPRLPLAACPWSPATSRRRSPPFLANKDLPAVKARLAAWLPRGRRTDPVRAAHRATGPAFPRLLEGPFRGGVFLSSSTRQSGSC